jgi:predicted ATPase
VRDALQRRIALLAAPVRHLLTTASVLGREFHRQVLAAAAAFPVAQTDRLLDQAVAARLVVARGGGRFAFAHDLVRESLYAGLDEDDRCRRHAGVVDAIERTPTLAERVLPGELAGHAYLAGADLEPGRVVEHLLAAARNANSRLAADEAIEHLRRAFERVGHTDLRKRVTVALDLGRELERGDAAVRSGGGRGQGRRRFRAVGAGGVDRLPDRRCGHRPPAGGRSAAGGVRGDGRCRAGR